MRKIELRTVEDINVLFVDGDPTNIQYTRDDMNFMLDDLAASFPSRNRNDILTELIQRSSAKANLVDGPLTGDELKQAVSLVSKSCKTGWFWPPSREDLATGANAVLDLQSAANHIAVKSPSLPLPCTEGR